MILEIYRNKLEKWINDINCAWWLNGIQQTERNGVKAILKSHDNFDNADNPTKYFRKPICTYLFRTEILKNSINWNHRLIKKFKFNSKRGFGPIVEHLCSTHLPYSFIFNYLVKRGVMTLKIWGSSWVQ